MPSGLVLPGVGGRRGFVLVFLRVGRAGVAFLEASPQGGKPPDQRQRQDSGENVCIAGEHGKDYQCEFDDQEDDEADYQQRYATTAEAERSRCRGRDSVTGSGDEEADGLKDVRCEEAQGCDAEEIIERLLVDERRE